MRGKKPNQVTALQERKYSHCAILYSSETNLSYSVLCDYDLNTNCAVTIMGMKNGEGCGSLRERKIFTIYKRKSIDNALN